MAESLRNPTGREFWDLEDGEETGANDEKKGEKETVKVIGRVRREGKDMEVFGRSDFVLII